MWPRLPGEAGIPKEEAHTTPVLLSVLAEAVRPSHTLSPVGSPRKVFTENGHCSDLRYISRVETKLT